MTVYCSPDTAAVVITSCTCVSGRRPGPSRASPLRTRSCVVPTPRWSLSRTSSSPTSPPATVAGPAVSTWTSPVRSGFQRKRVVELPYHIARGAKGLLVLAAALFCFPCLVGQSHYLSVYAYRNNRGVRSVL